MARSTLPPCELLPSFAFSPWRLVSPGAAGPGLLTPLFLPRSHPDGRGGAAEAGDDPEAEGGGSPEGQSAAQAVGGTAAHHRHPAGRPPQDLRPHLCRLHPVPGASAGQEARAAERKPQPGPGRASADGGPWPARNRGGGGGCPARAGLPLPLSEFGDKAGKWPPWELLILHLSLPASSSWGGGWREPFLQAGLRPRAQPLRGLNFLLLR